jgi:hypothetical protein
MPVTRCQVRFRNSTSVLRLPLPRRDFSIPSDRSAQPDSKRRGLPWQVARSSFAPRRARIITYRFARRIIVPDPLLTAKLAVLRTSWNLSHHAPGTRCGQVETERNRLFSSKQIGFIISGLSRSHGGPIVDKSAVAKSVCTFLMVRGKVTCITISSMMLGDAVNLFYPAQRSNSCIRAKKIVRD